MRTCKPPHKVDFIRISKHGLDMNRFSVYKKIVHLVNETSIVDIFCKNQSRTYPLSLDSMKGPAFFQQ